jgi:hypothetical protein
MFGLAVILMEPATGVSAADWHHVSRVWTPPVPQVTEHALHAVKPYTGHSVGMQFCMDRGAIPTSAWFLHKESSSTATSGVVLSAQYTLRVCTPQPHDTEHVDQVRDENT